MVLLLFWFGNKRKKSVFLKNRVALQVECWVNWKCFLCLLFLLHCSSFFNQFTYIFLLASVFVIFPPFPLVSMFIVSFVFVPVYSCLTFHLPFSFIWTSPLRFLDNFISPFLNLSLFDWKVRLPAKKSSLRYDTKLHLIALQEVESN